MSVSSSLTTTLHKNKHNNQFGYGSPRVGYPSIQVGNGLPAIMSFSSLSAGVPLQHDQDRICLAAPSLRCRFIIGRNSLVSSLEDNVDILYVWTCIKGF